MFNNIIFICHSQRAEGNMNANALFCPLKNKSWRIDMYRWWQAADRDPSGREVLADVSVYCSVCREKVRDRERGREQNDSQSSSVSDDSVKTKRTEKFITWLCHFPASAVTSQKRFYNSTSHIKMALKGWIFTFCASFRCKYCIPWFLWFRFKWSKQKKESHFNTHVHCTKIFFVITILKSLCLSKGLLSKAFTSDKITHKPYPQLSVFGSDGKWRILRKSKNIFGRTSFSMIIVYTHTHKIKWLFQNTGKGLFVTVWFNLFSKRINTWR